MAAVVLMVASVTLALPATAEDGTVPGSCKVHEEKVLNPGCVPALVDRVEEQAEPVVDPPETYPDLVPDVRLVYVYRPIIGLDPVTRQLLYGPPELAFDTWSQNTGTVALDLVTNEPSDLETPSVSQCVVWVVDGVCRERRAVGGFEVHPTHNHVHFQEFAQYELRGLLADGTPDYSAAGLIDISEKVSFCLLDSRRIRDDARPVQTYIGCTSAREGISAGWADIYDADLFGQQLAIDGLPDGRYALIVRMDYANRLWEADETNNIVEVIVELSTGNDTAVIVSKRWPA